MSSKSRYVTETVLIIFKDEKVCLEKLKLGEPKNLLCDEMEAIFLFHFISREYIKDCLNIEKRPAF